MFLFPLEVGVEEGRVAFATAPEDVARAAEFMRDLQGLFHLRRREGERVGVAARRRAVDIARIGEQVGGAPEELDAGALLLLLEYFDDGVKVLVGIAKALTLGRDVAV